MTASQQLATLLDASIGLLQQPPPLRDDDARQFFENLPLQRVFT